MKKEIVKQSMFDLYSNMNQLSLIKPYRNHITDTIRYLKNDDQIKGIYIGPGGSGKTHALIDFITKKSFVENNLFFSGRFSNDFIIREANSIEEYCLDKKNTLYIDALNEFSQEAIDIIMKIYNNSESDIIITSRPMELFSEFKSGTHYFSLRENKYDIIANYKFDDKLNFKDFFYFENYRTFNMFLKARHLGYGARENEIDSFNVSGAYEKIIFLSLKGTKHLTLLWKIFKDYVVESLYKKVRLIDFFDLKNKNEQLFYDFIIGEGIVQPYTDMDILSDKTFTTSFAVREILNNIYSSKKDLKEAAREILMWAYSLSSPSEQIDMKMIAKSYLQRWMKNKKNTHYRWKKANEFLSILSQRFNYKNAYDWIPQSPKSMNIEIENYFVKRSDKVVHLLTGTDCLSVLAELGFKRRRASIYIEGDIDFSIHDYFPLIIYDYVISCPWFEEYKKTMLFSEELLKIMIKYKIDVNHSYFETTQYMRIDKNVESLLLYETLSRSPELREKINDWFIKYNKDSWIIEDGVEVTVANICEEYGIDEIDENSLKKLYDNNELKMSDINKPYIFKDLAPNWWNPVRSDVYELFLSDLSRRFDLLTVEYALKHIRDQIDFKLDSFGISIYNDYIKYSLKEPPNKMGIQQFWFDGRFVKKINTNIYKNDELIYSYGKSRSREPIVAHIGDNALYIVSENGDILEYDKSIMTYDINEMKWDTGIKVKNWIDFII